MIFSICKALNNYHEQLVLCLTSSAKQLLISSNYKSCWELGKQNFQLKRETLHQ